MEDVNTRRLFPDFDKVLQNSTPEKFAKIWPIERDGISAMKFEAAGFLFLSDVFVAVAVAVVVAKATYEH